MEAITPISASAATAATRDLPGSPGGLTVGQVMQARVARVDGDTVVLRWGEQTLSVASKIPLTVGQQVNLMVEEGSAGKTLLRMLDETFGKGRTSRADGTNGGRAGSGQTTAASGRGASTPTGAAGRGGRDVGGGSGGDQGFADPPAEWGFESAGRDASSAGPNGQRGPTSQNGTPAQGSTLTQGGAALRNGAVAQGSLTSAPAQNGAMAPNGTIRTPGAPANNPAPPTATAGPLPGGRATLPGTPGLPSSPTLLDATALADAPDAPDLAGQLGMPARPGQSAMQDPASAPGLMLRASSTFTAPELSGPNLTARSDGGGGVGRAPSRTTAAPANGQFASTLSRGQAVAAFARRAAADPLASVLFTSLDDDDVAETASASSSRAAEPSDTRTHAAAATSRSATATAAAASRGSTAATSASVAVLLARAALPAYGRLAQSVGGDDTFGTLLNTLGREAGQTLARAPLSTADVGRLLVDVGLHPDEMNAVLVSEMLTQGSPVTEPNIRILRRELAAAGGGPADAASAVLLTRLGLPVTPLSLGIARQLLAGQLDPRAVWDETLGELQDLARGLSDGQPAGGPAASTARELLSAWRVPIEGGAAGVSRWLQTSIEQAATPLEAKLARPLALPGEAPAANPALSQDVRSRLDALAQALGQPVAGGTHSLDRGPAAQALQRLQATIQAEQVLNGASREPDGQRFFVVTLPALAGRQPGSLELRVRERDARQPASGEPVRPDVVRLKLSLPNLGDLAINLTVGHTSIACNFSASSQFSEALIGASSGELIGRLKRLGYQQTTVETSQETTSPPILPADAAPSARVHRVDTRA